MSEDDQQVTITQTLKDVLEQTQGDEISMSDLVEVLNHKGFGPLLIAPSLITVLPTGGIPGVPAICGVFIIFVAAQMLMGRSCPWLPKKLGNISFSRETYEKSVKKAEPYTKKFDSLFHPRLEYLTNKIAQRIIAFVSILLSIAMISIGFIPFAPAMLALVILMFGLGLSVHDGLLTALSVLPMIGALIVLPVAIF